MKIFILIFVLQTSPNSVMTRHALVYKSAEICLSEKVTLEANIIKNDWLLSYSDCVKEWVRTDPDDFIKPVERKVKL